MKLAALFTAIALLVPLSDASAETARPALTFLIPEVNDWAEQTPAMLGMENVAAGSVNFVKDATFLVFAERTSARPPKYDIVPLRALLVENKWTVEYVHRVSAKLTVMSVSAPEGLRIKLVVRKIDGSPSMRVAYVCRWRTMGTPEEVTAIATDCNKLLFETHALRPEEPPKKK